MNRKGLDTLARCIFAGFNMRIGTGVGYVIPQPVTKAINFFLGAPAIIA